MIGDEVHAKEIRRLPSQVNAGLQKMSSLHDAMMKILKPVVEAGFASLKVDKVKKDIWNCFPTFLSCCFYIFEVINMF